ncbi:phage head closure protein [Heyndrickxia ginsengihumi]|uniref:phage head closure protein n=1 Tax=Heyndrickxia ginsengihumi TaxID=363870 RepID=UPI00047237E8|nr:phage head closure protein [Heyndrickxia ginsengihumi]
MKRLTNAGQMNQRVEFYKVEKSKDDWGDITEQDVLVFSCWANIRTQFLKEIQATIGTVLENTITFIIRYQQAQPITNDMTIVHNGMRYGIIQINQDLQNKEFTTVICKAVS